VSTQNGHAERTEQRKREPQERLPPRALLESERLSALLERGGFALLKALLAIDGPTLRGLERNGGLLPALRACRRCLHTLPGHLAPTRVPLALAVLTTLGFVLEVLVCVEELLARSPDEWLVAFDAHQALVSVLHGLSSESGPPTPSFAAGEASLGLATNLLPVPFAGKGLLRPLLVAGFQVKAVLLDVLDDIFLLDLPFEATEGVFDGLALLELDLGQNVNTP
jgi:hypothetical protein